MGLAVLDVPRRGESPVKAAASEGVRRRRGGDRNILKWRLFEARWLVGGSTGWLDVWRRRERVASGQQWRPPATVSTSGEGETEGRRWGSKAVVYVRY